MAYVLTKSAKGLREATGKTRELHQDLLDVLKICKGQFVAEDLVATARQADQEAVALALRELVNGGFLREVAELSEGDDEDGEAGGLNFVEGVEDTDIASTLAGARDEEPDPLADMVFTPELRKRAGDSARGMLKRSEAKEAEVAPVPGESAEELERRKAEKKRRWDDTKAALQEAADRAKQAAEEAARRKEAELQRQKAQEIADLEEQQRAKAEAEARAREAEEKARRKAEEKARREEEERKRREEEERKRREEEERRRIEAEERARKREEERLRREAEAKARAEAEAKARAEALERERLAAEERERELIRERLRGIRRRQRTVGMVMGSIMLTGLALFGVQLISIDGKRAEFERIASAALGEPVQAQAAYFELLPPHWRIEEVSLGNGGLRIASLDVATSFGGLFSLPQQFVSLRGNRAKITLEYLATATAKRGGSLPVADGVVRLNGVVVQGGGIESAPMDLALTVAGGKLTGVTGGGRDADHGQARVEAAPEADHWRFSAELGKVVSPLGKDQVFSDVKLQGELHADRVKFDEMIGVLHSGTFSGAGNVVWRDGWQATGSFNVNRIDFTQLAPGWLRTGFGNGEFDFVAAGADAKSMWNNLRAKGAFDGSTGRIDGIDFDRVLQGRGIGDFFAYEILSGRFIYEAGAAEFTDLHARAKGLDARGVIAIASDGAVNGRIGMEVRTPTGRLTGAANVTGSIDTPVFKP